jgi:putative transposase
VKLRNEQPSWGAAKIREKLIRTFPMAKSTVHAVLDRHSLVERRKRRRYKAQGTSLTDPSSPNRLWCADFKGEFMLGNRQYCYPLTITDYCSRYLLACESLQPTKSSFAFSVFKQAFKDFGLPRGSATTTALPSPLPMHCSA